MEGLDFPDECLGVGGRSLVGDTDSFFLHPLSSLVTDLRRRGPRVNDGGLIQLARVHISNGKVGLWCCAGLCAFYHSCFGNCKFPELVTHPSTPLVVTHPSTSLHYLHRPSLDDHSPLCSNLTFQSRNVLSKKLMLKDDGMDSIRQVIQLCG